jgi:ribosomal-protein-alanine N-acetyltransferase
MTRVFLRQPAAGDRGEMVALMRASRRLHASWVSPPLDGEAFHAFLAAGRRPANLTLLACRVADRAIAGVFQLSGIARGTRESACLSYYAGAPYAGQGYMTEGLKLVLRHAFVHLRLHRLEANVQPANLASIALIERCGFEYEGFSPRYLKIRNRWRDHERWALRVETWRRRRRTQLG